MSKPISTMDHSVAYSCLLHLYPWYGQADSRDTGAVTNHLVEEWRSRVANGGKDDCFSIAKEIEEELRSVLAAAVNERLGE